MNKAQRYDAAGWQLCESCIHWTWDRTRYGIVGRCFFLANYISDVEQQYTAHSHTCGQWQSKQQPREPYRGELDICARDEHIAVLRDVCRAIAVCPAVDVVGQPDAVDVRVPRDVWQRVREATQ